MTDTTKARYNGGSGETPLDFVIRLVADHRDTDTANLPTLDHYVDEALVNHFLRRPPAAGELQLWWDEVMVTLSADRTVEITTADGGETLPSRDRRIDGGSGTLFSPARSNTGP